MTIKRLLASLALVAMVAIVPGGEAHATALSAARNTKCRLSGITKRYLMADTVTIYAGSLVMIDSDGLANPAAAEASNKNVAGVAQETVVGTGTTDYIKVSDGVICKFAGTTLGQDDVGSAVYAEDDQTVDETVGSNEPVAGVLVQYVSASSAWVYVSSLVNFGRVAVSQPLTLTDVLTLSEAATIGQATDTEIEFTENSEDFSFDFKTNEIEMSSDTGVVQWDFGAVGTTITLANGQAVVSDTDNEIQFGDGSEDVAMGFGTANTLNWSSDTGVVNWDLTQITAITLGNDETIKNDNDGEIELGDGTEDLAISFTANSADWSSDTGVVEWDFAATGTTLTLANDQYIVSDEDNVVKIGDAEDIEFDFSVNNTLTLSSDSGVTKVDFVSMNIETDGTFQVLGSGATIGWTIADGANTACSTTCAGTGSAVVGIDTGTGLFVLPNSANADSCICAGPAS